MEIKHYTLNPGIEGEILYTYVRIGKKDYYFQPKTMKLIKSCILCLTFATLPIIVVM